MSGLKSHLMHLLALADSHNISFVVCSIQETCRWYLHDCSFRMNSIVMKMPGLLFTTIAIILSYSVLFLFIRSNYRSIDISDPFSQFVRLLSLRPNGKGREIISVLVLCVGFRQLSFIQSLICTFFHLSGCFHTCW